jgi:hypothetical protein
MLRKYRAIEGMRNAHTPLKLALLITIQLKIYFLKSK